MTGTQIHSCENERQDQVASGANRLFASEDVASHRKSRSTSSVERLRSRREGKDMRAASTANRTTTRKLDLPRDSTGWQKRSFPSQTSPRPPPNPPTPHTLPFLMTIPNQTLTPTHLRPLSPTNPFAIIPSSTSTSLTSSTTSSPARCAASTAPSTVCT